MRGIGRISYLIFNSFKIAKLENQEIVAILELNELIKDQGYGATAGNLRNDCIFDWCSLEVTNMV